jgi:hypothetical protein
VAVSDATKAWKGVREAEFSQALWILDRWHIAKKVRDFVGDNPREYQRVMVPVWKARSEAVLEALRTSSLRENRKKQFATLFGYILGNREGIDNWRAIPASLRHSIGRRIASVRSGSGFIENNIEVHINRRFKPQGRSWSRKGAEHPVQLLWLHSHTADWTHWWKLTALAKTKVNPRWPSSAPPPNRQLTNPTGENPPVPCTLTQLGRLLESRSPIL